MKSNLLYLAKIKKVNGKEVVLDLAEDLNIERLRTVYYKHKGDRYCELRFLDPRSFEVQQRKYYYALLGDISNVTGHLIEEVDDNIKWRFRALTGRSVSLSNGSSSTKDDITLLINIALDLAFELNTVLSNKIPIPDRNVEYYLYKCLTTRRCCICGKHADIDHFDTTVGMGNNRKEVDKTQYTYCALCRSHHTEKHTIGLTAFKEKYKVYGIKLNEETIKRLHI